MEGGRPARRWAPCARTSGSSERCSTSRSPSRPWPRSSSDCSDRAMAEPILLATATAEDTRAVGEALGSVLSAGDLVSLTGDLGAGKTTFIQGAARALGVHQPVLSPTFTLVREYRGRVPVVHLDVYRLERIQDVV